ncbi:PREDICTED: uncharacterized protein LOC105969495 isoform X1 [Erythranthe guttata]|uniref:uncharacterized protein LOC105969495 isoform X1 n=1 Tax=Erythranthe guttata TaxID=4155 RepID=UPI00064DC706|nr:PREDICTED: uncharacterized protein LOC105969495 isoform X1 [Erythranthe guttata]|eukprot:XP_012849704.1 PREDICTED: uncharacterized protein LOC105969495 isoform X1 [Erythranthe guttata]
MDKSWIKLNDFTSNDFVTGVKNFMRFALMHIGERKVMRCPCSNCLNQIVHPPPLVKLHILTNGMDIDKEGAKANKEGKVKCLKPRAVFTLSQKEKKRFCEFLKAVKFPDGYAANISRCVNIKDDKITGLKSHDCHVLLQRLLPVGLRGYLNKDVLDVITELACFFRQLCSRKLNLEVLDDLEKKIPVILSKMEMIFPPAFFDVMIHLAVHLAQEAKVGGPVHYRWMYPIERYLSSLKRMVRN